MSKWRLKFKGKVWIEFRLRWGFFFDSAAQKNRKRELSPQKDVCFLLFLPPQVATVWAVPRQEVERRRRLCCPSYRNCQRSRTASSAWCSPPPGQCWAWASSALTSMALIARGWTDRLFTGWLFLLRNVHAIFYQIMKVMRQVRSSVIQHKSAVAFIINTKSDFSWSSNSCISNLQCMLYVGCLPGSWPIRLQSSFGSWGSLLVWETASLLAEWVMWQQLTYILQVFP